jgi:hypothetical protein
VGLLLCLLLSATQPAIVEGRVGERGGADAPFAQVTLAQGDRTQVVRTGSDGKFRFRAFDGGGTLTVKLPQGWTSSEPLSRTVGRAFRGDTIRNDFAVIARRVLRGRLVLAGAPLADAQVTAGIASGSTDAQGLFVLDHLPPGVIEVRVEAPPLAGRVELPAGPCDLSRDVTLFAPDFASLPLERVPQDGAERAIADWLSSRRLGEHEVARLERLAALVALAPDFRLAMIARPREVTSGARAAALLQRYLTGPALVPRERLIFAVAEFARPGHLGLILTRLQEPR